MRHDECEKKKVATRDSGSNERRNELRINEGFYFERRNTPKTPNQSNDVIKAPLKSSYWPSDQKKTQLKTYNTKN